nr:grasp-with-spasm system A modified peptide [uncultured Bacteroides sp.]
MRNLGKLKLSDAKVMDSNEMKAIIGGQMGNTQCRNTGTGSGFESKDDVTCSGECPVVPPAASGSTEKPIKRTCQVEEIRGIFGKPSSYFCTCK